MSESTPMSSAAPSPGDISEAKSTLDDPRKLAAEGKWAEAFNALPLWIRRIGAAQECQTRIQQLDMEKERINSRRTRDLREVAEHRRNCERGLGRLEREGEEA